jgi:hypothetical protein
MTTTSTPMTTAAPRGAERGAVRRIPVKVAPKAMRTPMVGKRDRAHMRAELVERIDRADIQDIPMERLHTWCEDAARTVAVAHPHHSAKTKPAALAGNRRAQERRMAWLRDSTATRVEQLYRERERVAATTGQGRTPLRHGAARLYDCATLRAIVAGEI